MSDWNLTEKRIYKLLRHPYQLDKSVAEDMTPAHLEFVEELFDYSDRISDSKIRIRQLSMSYTDSGTSKTLEESYPTENSKLKLVFLDKLLPLINMEQELIYWQVEYPKLPINIESEWKSPFYLNNEAIKLADIMELVRDIFYISDDAIRIDHKEILLGDAARIFERMFNVNFGDIYKKESVVIKRKPMKITEFPDRLKVATIQENKEEGHYHS